MRGVSIRLAWVSDPDRLFNKQSAQRSASKLHPYTIGNRAGRRFFMEQESAKLLKTLHSLRLLKACCRLTFLVTADSTLADQISLDLCRFISETRQGLSVFRAQAHGLITIILSKTKELSTATKTTTPEPTDHSCSGVVVLRYS